MNTIGGFDKLFLIYPSAVSCVSIVHHLAAVALKPQRDWWELPVTPEGITAELSMDSETTPALFAVSITTRIPQTVLDSATINRLLSLNGMSVLAIAVANNGSSWLYGTKEYPLMARCIPLTPSEANGYSGLELTLTGKSPYGSLLTQNPANFE